MTQKAADGIEVVATIKSLALLLHQIVRGNREATPNSLSYFMQHVIDLFPFARKAATIAKLQMILKTLQSAKSAFEQEEDAESLLRDAWQLMRKVVSQEEVEKISALQIELRRSGMETILVSGTDPWKQANRIIHSWSPPEKEGQRVEYAISYRDGEIDGRWLNLPLFYQWYSGKRSQIEPALDLGKQIIAALEKSIDLGSENQASFDAARHSALMYLRRYEVGGSAGAEAVTEAIIKIQDEQWSPGIVYRRSLWQ